MKKCVMCCLLSLFLLLVGCRTTTVEDISYDINLKFISPYNSQSIKADVDFHRLFSNELKHSLTIEITREEWNKLNEDMLHYSDLYEHDLRSDTYFKAKLIYTDIHGTVVADEVGFRTRGNDSRTYLQNEDGSYNLSHFKVKFNETFDYEKESKIHTLLKDRKVFDLEEMNLKFIKNDDFSYLTELHSYNLMNQAGVPAPLITLVDLTIKIDNEAISYGIYNLIEPIDKEFLDKRYSKKESNGNLYKCLTLDLGKASLETITNPNLIGIKDVKLNYRPTYDLKTNKKQPNFNDLTEFIYSINTLKDSDLKTYLDKQFEIDSFIRLLAINALIGNADDYRGNGNNYYLYFNPQSKKMMMIPYDIDQSLGVGNSKYHMYSDIYYWRNNTILFQTKEIRPLTDKVLLIPEYQEIYEKYLNLFIEDDIYTYQNFLETINQYRELYPSYEFNDLYTKTFIENKIISIKQQLTYYDLNPNKKRGDIS